MVPTDYLKYLMGHNPLVEYLMDDLPTETQDIIHQYAIFKDRKTPKMSTFKRLDVADPNPPNYYTSAERLAEARDKLDAQKDEWDPDDTL